MLSSPQLELPDLLSSDCIADLKLRKQIQMDYPGACSLEFQNIMDTVIKIIFNWDTNNQEDKGPGIFRIVVVFASGGWGTRLQNFAPPHSDMGEGDRSEVKEGNFLGGYRRKGKSKNQVSELYWQDYEHRIKTRPTCANFLLWCTTSEVSWCTSWKAVWGY